MIASDAIRGSALAETALVLTATLAMIFGIIQIGTIGFLQLACDGAAFIAAHEYSLGNTATYAASAKRPFPQTAAIFVDQNGPDTSTVAVDYGSTGDQYARHGGASLITGSHLQVTVHRSAPTGLLGVGNAGLANIDVHGSAIEPQSLVGNQNYDVGGAGYSAPTAQVAFSTNNVNAGLYYISQHRLLTCGSPSVTSFGATCPSNALYTYSQGPNVLRSLGTAEFLDFDNWNRTNMGVGSYGAGYTFGEMLCHQQMFAKAATSVFTPASTNAAMPRVNTSLTTGATGVVGQIYSWDITFRTDTYGSGGFSPWMSVPLTPAKFCP